MGGAFAGIIAALLFRNADPLPPRPRYSWEDEEDEAEPLADDELEPPSPQRVPVLWQPREGRLRGDSVPPAGRTARLKRGAAGHGPALPCGRPG